MGSKRLPGKALMEILPGTTVLSSTISQMRCCKKIDEMIVATTTNAEDDAIVTEANKAGTDIFRGSAMDVLDRYYKCANACSASVIVRITADNPLVDPHITDTAVDTFVSSSVDYLSNTQPRTFPYGTDVEIFSFQALQTAWNNAKKQYEREHVTPYIYNNPSKFKIKNMVYDENLSHLRLTVDYSEDLELVRKIASKISHRPMLLGDILNILQNAPDLTEINKAHTSQ